MLRASRGRLFQVCVVPSAGGSRLPVPGLRLFQACVVPGLRRAQRDVGPLADRRRVRARARRPCPRVVPTVRSRSLASRRVGRHLLRPALGPRPPLEVRRDIGRLLCVVQIDWGRISRGPLAAPLASGHVVVRRRVGPCGRFACLRRCRASSGRPPARPRRPPGRVSCVPGPSAWVFSCRCASVVPRRIMSRVPLIGAL